jgi:lipoate-protein ligase A
MAIDQAMLERAEGNRPTMRVYRWRPYCISLGYHQSAECIDLDKCLQDRIDVVRRPTGGRAVLHAEEVTYSVVIPQDDESLSGNLGEVYNAISRGLVRGIQRLGIPAELQKRSLDLRNHYRTSISVSCFSAAAKHEVVLNGKKLIGSAQRRFPHGILQHGSILTGSAHVLLPKYLKGMDEDETDRMIRMVAGRTMDIDAYLQRPVAYDEIVDAIKVGMAEELSITFVTGELTKEESKRVDELYRSFSIFSGRMIPLPDIQFDHSRSS